MRTNRQRFDPMALIAGVVFTAIAIAYLLRAGGHALVSPEWSLATAAIGVGLAGLAGALWSMLPTGRSDARSAAPTPPARFFAPVAAPEPGGTAFVGREGQEERGGALGEGTGTKPDPKAGSEAEPEPAAGLGAEPEPATRLGWQARPEAATELGTDVETGADPGTGVEPDIAADTVEAPAEPAAPAGSSAARAAASPAASDGGPDDTPPAVDPTK